MARLLNVGIAVCEILTFVMSELRSRLVDGTSVTVERLDHIHTHDIEESFRTENQVYCWGILSLKPASSIGNTYFHADTSFIAILRSNC